ncbi:MAG: sigma-70 family RNA polymerase sigma factor [Bacteroidetes bacterium]|nr:sigma-70 family RNA polymerase sigma factor [Bacteroidota bacterium]
MALSAPSTDIELLQRTANYDSKALEALYNRYSSLLYTLIKKIVDDETTAEDVLSDVFTIIWKKANYFDFSTENVYTWLVALARNKAVDSLKRLQENNNLEPYSEDFENKYIIPHLSPSIDSLNIKTAINLKENVETALNKLTDAQQYVIYLAYYEGLTQKEIASKLNIPLATVKSKIKIALSNLKGNLIKGET